MHIPYQLKQYRFFDIGMDHYYYEDLQTEESVAHIVETSYLPLCRTLLEMINLSKHRFHCSLTITGITIELFEQYFPEMIDLLKSLANTSCVDFLVTPYSYSLASEYAPDEYVQQLLKQQEMVGHLFGVSSKVVCNPELVYADNLAAILKKHGFAGMLIEGAKHILSWKSPNYVYSSVQSNFALLPRNFEMSDELSFHFSDNQWTHYPIDAEKWINRIVELPDASIVSIFLGADTFGIRQTKESGIFAFLLALPYYGLEHNVTFLTPTQAFETFEKKDVITALHSVSWTGETKDINAFVGNDLQQEVINKLYAVTERVHLCKDNRLKSDWLVLQDISYLRYMNFVDNGSYASLPPYDAFINYMNILADFLQCVNEQYPVAIEDEELNELLTTIKNQEKEILALRSQLKVKTNRKKTV